MRSAGNSLHERNDGLKKKKNCLLNFQFTFFHSFVAGIARALCSMTEQIYIQEKRSELDPDAPGMQYFLLS